MVHRISELIPVPTRDFIYDLLKEAPPRLAVDIGAAAGSVTLKLHQLAPKSRIVAFEPFPGNFKHFETNAGALPNVSLVRKAVSDSVGVAHFYVQSSVQGNEPGWENQVGYSSVGYLVNATPGLRQQVRRYLGLAKRMALSALRKETGQEMLRVETTTIDKEFPSDRIDFMKIDVQGAEAKVLRGAASKLERHEVDLLYIEWTGDPTVEDLLTRRGYRIYDSTYIVGPKQQEKRPFEEIGFRFLANVPLSTGETAFEFYLPADGPSPESALESVKRQKLGWIQTDLIALSPNFAAEFSKAVETYSSNH